MKPRTAIVLAVIAVLVIGATLLFAGPAGAPGRAAAVAPGTLVFPGLAPQLQQARRVEITSKGQTLAIARTEDTWGLADRGNYPVQQDKLREVLTGLTELRLAEPRTSEPSLYERLGVGDPGAATSTANLVKLLDGSGKTIAELIVGHRRVRTQANVPETIYVRRPGEAQSWLAEGRLPVDADPQLWLDRDITNIGAAKVASVVVRRGDEVLEFGRQDEKPVLKVPAEHPKLDEYRLEDVFRALETLTLSDVRPVAQQPGEPVGTAEITTTDGTVVEAKVFRADKDVWTQFAVRGDSAEAKQLAARVAGWTYQVGAWKEKAFLPTLDGLKASEPDKPAEMPGGEGPATEVPATEVPEGAMPGGDVSGGAVPAESQPEAAPPTGAAAPPVASPPAPAVAAPAPADGAAPPTEATQPPPAPRPDAGPAEDKKPE